MSLTKQQIESEGWIPRDEFNNFWTKDDEGHTAFLQFYPVWEGIPSWITIGYIIDVDNYGEYRFSGSCPDISDLRYICKLIQLK